MTLNSPDNGENLLHLLLLLACFLVINYKNFNLFPANFYQLNINIFENKIFSDPSLRVRTDKILAGVCEAFILYDLVWPAGSYNIFYS